MNLEFQFDNLASFWAMAGHGPYVWACYGITGACLILLAVAPLRRRRVLFEQLRRQQRIAEHERSQMQSKTSQA